MLFIDEPPFLDADGTEAYADALTNMASRNPDMRILAISHDPTMKARFQQNILITASESGSQVTMN
jgi:exonuclease SbcC